MNVYVTYDTHTQKAIHRFVHMYTCTSSKKAIKLANRPTKQILMNYLCDSDSTTATVQ